MRDQDMIKEAEIIAQLLFKELQDELTPAERQQLNQWRYSQDDASRKFFEDMMELPRLEKDLQLFDSFNPAMALADVQQKIASQESANPAAAQGSSVPGTPGSAYPYPGEMQTSRPAGHRRRRMALAIVAGVIVLAGSGLLYFNIKGRTPPSASAPIVQADNREIIPGGDKAILTLADGSKITLDQVANGSLTRQGTAQVSKEANGELIYETDKGQTVSPAAIVFNSITTPRGGQYQVSLPDGSKVWLNAASSLRFPTAFSGKERRVELSGEAYFEIAQNPSAPFRVVVSTQPSDIDGKIAGKNPEKKMEIEVLGTSFDIEAYAEDKDQRTTLINGAVKVLYGKEQSVLKPGQQARIAHASQTPLKIISDINTDEVVAWKNGSFLFQSAGMETVMNQLARWYDVQVEYAGPKPTQTLTAKVSRNNNLADILKVLEISGYHFEIKGRVIIVKN